MSFSVTNATWYALVPMGATLLGGLLAFCFHPKEKLFRFFEHLVAGVIIAAVAIELIPKLLVLDAPWRMGFGFLLGAFFMLILRKLFSKLSGLSQFTLVLAAALDLLIDGVLIALAFVAGRHMGVVIALSLCLCGFLLNFTVSTNLISRNWMKFFQILVIVCLALMLPLGAWSGNYLIEVLPRRYVLELFSFAAAALLFLGVEELIGKGECSKEPILTSSGFFFGFLLLLILR